MIIIEKKLFELLHLLLEKEILHETFVDISELIADNQFKRLGVADIVIQKISKQKSYGVIPTDLDLYIHLKDNNIKCINFNHWSH